MSGYYDDPGGLLADRRNQVVAGLVAVAVFAAVFLIGHSLGGGGSAAAPPPASTVTATVTAAAPAVASPPVTAPKSGQVHRHASGVLVGYTLDQTGAVAAAGNYVSALYLQTNRTAERERAMLAAIAAAPIDADRIAGDFSGEDQALAQMLGVTSLQQPGVIAFGRPLGYRVDSSTAAQVVIDVHTAGGQGLAGSPEDATTAPRGFLEVNRLQLVWSNGDWKLKNWSRLLNGGPEMGSLAAQGYTPFSIGEAP